jgi:small subunit ribosomal protein S17
MAGDTRAPISTTGKKVLTGQVVSDKMDKTIVVTISRRKIHSLYKKYLTKTRKFKAHDEANDAHVGDTVRIVESRPISKEKRWRLLDIVERAR